MSLDHFNAAFAYGETDQGRVMAREVIRRPVTIDARVSPQDTLCVFYGGRSGNRMGFSPSTSLFLCQYLAIRINSFISDAT
jgi:hypothetical protein